MPIYEYRCRECRHRFEALRGITQDDREIACPQCGALQVERVFSTFGTSRSSSEGDLSSTSCRPGSSRFG